MCDHDDVFVVSLTGPSLQFGTCAIWRGWISAGGRWGLAGVEGGRGGPWSDSDPQIGPGGWQHLTDEGLAAMAECSHLRILNLTWYMPAACLGLCVGGVVERECQVAGVGV